MLARWCRRLRLPAVRCSVCMERKTPLLEEYDFRKVRPVHVDVHGTVQHTRDANAMYDRMLQRCCNDAT